MVRAPNEGRGVQSIEVGIRVLDALTHAARPTKLKDIARVANVAPAQAHAYLVSFRRQNLVEQDDATGLYRLGHFALQLGIARMRSFDPIRTASDAVVALATETNLTTALSVWGSFGPTVIYIREGTGQLHINTRAGTVYSVTGTATGLVFAAYLPQELVKAAIKAQLAETVATQRVGARLQFAAIAGGLKEIRQRGYATIDPPPVPGIHAIAAPVFDLVGQIRMAITLIGSAATIDVSAGSSHVEQLREAARLLNEQMGYFPDLHNVPPRSAANSAAEKVNGVDKRVRRSPGRSKVTLLDN
jgi:DNA-binding IclR family transcriptional regulator